MSERAHPAMVTVRGQEHNAPTMRVRPLPLALLLIAGLVSACGPKGPAAPTREQLKAKLDQEAQALKRDGEKGPDLGVKSVWTVEAVEMKEQPADKQRPWKGSVRIRIDTRSPGYNDRIVKTFDYTWDTAANQWLMEYKPSK